MKIDNEKNHKFSALYNIALTFIGYNIIVPRGQKNNRKGDRNMKLSYKEATTIYNLLTDKRDSIESSWRWYEQHNSEVGESEYKYEKTQEEISTHKTLSDLIARFESSDI